MTFVVPLKNFTPGSRDDGIPFITARIDEADPATAPLVITAIDTQPLVPVDPDPANPLTRNFTTHQATLANGIYRVAFIDAAGNEQITDWVGSMPWRPSVDDVAVLLRARTVVMGTQRGTFDDDTLPTASAVESLITEACNDLISKVGTFIPPPHQGEAERLSALRAAALIEASFFPDQLETDRSAHRQYTAMYLSGIEGLRGAIPKALRIA